MDDLAGRRTGERIQVLRERRGLTRPTLAGLVSKSASWLKGIETGRRLPPRLPTLVRLAQALGIGDVALLAGTDMDIGDAASIPLASFSRIPHGAVPAIRDAVREPLLRVTAERVDVPALAARVSQAWRLWHGSSTHRTDVGRVLPSLLRDARVAARQGDERRAANALLSDVYALVQHEIVWAAEPELIWVVADRSVAAAHAADQPVSLAGAAWTLAIVQRSMGDLDGALELVSEAAGILRPRLQDGPIELRAMYGALHLHAATTRARDGREGDALRHLDEARATAERLPTGYHHPWIAYPVCNDSVHYSPQARQIASDAVEHGGPMIDRRAHTFARLLDLPV